MAVNHSIPKRIAELIVTKLSSIFEDYEFWCQTHRTVTLMLNVRIILLAAVEDAVEIVDNRRDQPVDYTGGDHEPYQHH